jgi:hypothetical protein
LGLSPKQKLASFSSKTCIFFSEHLSLKILAMLALLSPLAVTHIVLEWSDPILVAAPTDILPKGPPVPESFHSFDDKHMFGPEYLGSSSSFSFSADGGRQWTSEGPNVPSVAAPLIPTAHGYRNLGGGLSFDAHSWNMTWPRTYTLTADGKKMAIADAAGGFGPSHKVRFHGLPYPGVNTSHPSIHPGSRNYGVVRKLDGSYVLATCILWNGLQPRKGPPHEGIFTPFSVVAFTSEDGYDWSYASVIANWSAADKYWGPNENDMSLLSDNKTLITVLRMDGDSNCASQSYRYYAASYSTDGGVSWSAPKSMDGAGCVRPKLKLLPSGPLLLTGGRLCVEESQGVYLWLNEDGMGGIGGRNPRTEWARHSISYQHNRLWRGDPRYLFNETVNASNGWGTLSYTSIMVTGPNSAAISYQQFGAYGPNHTVQAWPGPNSNFVIQLRLHLR